MANDALKLSEGVVTRSCGAAVVMFSLTVIVCEFPAQGLVAAKLFEPQVTTTEVCALEVSCSACGVRLMYNAPGVVPPYCTLSQDAAGMTEAV